jgi:hypothetical protein
MPTHLFLCLLAPESFNGFQLGHGLFDFTSLTCTKKKKGMNDRFLWRGYEDIPSCSISSVCPWIASSISPTSFIYADSANISL